MHPGHPASEYNTFYNLNLLVDIFIHPVHLYYIMINDNLVINSKMHGSGNTNVGDQNWTPSKIPGRRLAMTLQNELFLTLMRLRLGLLHQDLAYRFKTNTRQVSTIILTWIQLLYKQFGIIRNLMFSTRDKVRQHLPKCFKKYKNIRCIIDCIEVHVQSPGTRKSIFFI